MVHKMKNIKFNKQCKELIIDTDFCTKYKVDDIIAKNVDVVFLLESPHNEEVKCKHPLAGKSGVNMTKFIYKVFSLSKPKCCNKIIPFGKLVQDAHDPNIKDKEFLKLYGNSKLRDILKKI